MVISPLILWLVARALRARCDTQGRSTHHDDDTPPLHPHIKIEITKFDENTAQNENTGLSRELRQRQYNSDQCDRATVRGTRNVSYGFSG